MSEGPMRKILPYTLAALGLVLLYLGWVAATRYFAGRDIERAAKARQARPSPPTEETAGTAVKILQFYASTGEVTKGQHAIVCYGVENARAVRLEPAIEELKPARNRCFSVFPERTTTFKLLADGADGKQVSESFTVKVNPAPPSILFVAISHKEIKRGQPWTMCYGVANATAVRIEPAIQPLQVGEKQCIRTFPMRTATYTLVASGAGGREDREKFTLTVK